jgi:protein TonB
MSDKYIEKSFLLLVVISSLLHVAVFALLAYLPQQKPTVKPEPYMVELRDLPEQKLARPVPEKEAKRLAEKRARVARETAPKGSGERERIAPAPLRGVPQPPVTGGESRTPSPADRGGDMALQRKEALKDVFKPKSQEQPGLAQLFPSAGKMARLEESYRKKYGPEVAEGETKFLNTDDILFGSFLRRFETAVYGVWRYPQEAARQGIEGVTPVKITFNKKGEIAHIELLESSGSKILDNEVLRALRQLGPIGSFPKQYPKETFNLIAFFHYAISQGGISGTLR